MFPVSASGLGRVTTEPTVLGGYLVPASTEVQARPYGHKQNQYFLCLEPNMHEELHLKTFIKIFSVDPSRKL